MNIKRISQDKLRVDLSCSDLDKYDLDYQSISTSSPGTRRMLKDILLEAGDLEGFTTENCRLLIEVLPGKADGCTLYLTKLPAKETPPKELQKKSGSVTQQTTPGKCYILTCDCIEDAIGAINCFTNYPDIPLRKSSLYSYEDSYHLTFSPIRFGLDGDRLASLIASLSEYGRTGTATPAKEAILAEHGSAIEEGRAIECFIRYFH
jgi:adapter protein MecA 1/2